MACRGSTGAHVCSTDAAGSSPHPLLLLLLVDMCCRGCQVTAAGVLALYYSCPSPCHGLPLSTGKANHFVPTRKAGMDVLARFKSSLRSLSLGRAACVHMCGSRFWLLPRLLLLVLLVVMMVVMRRRGCRRCFRVFVFVVVGCHAMLVSAAVVVALCLLTCQLLQMVLSLVSLFLWVLLLFLHASMCTSVACFFLALRAAAFLVLSTPSRKFFVRVPPFLLSLLFKPSSPSLPLLASLDTESEGGGGVEGGAGGSGGAPNRSGGGKNSVWL